MHHQDYPGQAIDWGIPEYLSGNLTDQRAGLV